MVNLKVASITFIFLLLNQTSFTNAEPISSPTIISSLEGDVTGDEHHENIQIKGNLFENNRDFYQNIWIEIKNLHSDKWKIPLTSGYEPTIQLVDLNQNHVKDVFIQIIKNKEDRLYDQHLYSLKNGTIKEISLPKQSHITGNFHNDFQIEIQVSIKNDNPIVLDVSDSATEYVKNGIYETNGKLIRPLSILVAPISFYEPTFISKTKGYGLKSYQKISGAHPKDQLGTMEIVWYYENNTWVILKTSLIPS